VSESRPDLYLTIRETARRFRDGDLSPVDFVRASLERTAIVDASLQAFVEVLGEQALTAAKAAERELRQGSDSLLCGVPLAVKDIVDVEGLPTRCGSQIRANAPPATADAEVVRSLRGAGAVVVAKTVTQEFAAGTLSPPARNPWDASRVPGGSSGGSAVAVATGAAMTAIGSDTGGSIRNPAALCGVVGLKPTYGVVPTAGVYPLSWSLDTVGPLARTVDDAWISYTAMIGQVEPVALDRDLRGIRLGLLGGYFHERVDADTLTAVTSVAAVFRQLGAEVVETVWDDAAAARGSSFIINRLETVSVHEAMLRERREDLALLNPSLRLRLVAGQFIPAIDYVRAMRARLVVRDSIARFYATHRLDAVITPVAAATAVPAERPLVSWEDGDEDAGLAYTRLTQPFNATGQPAISLPCGFDRDGLPIGLQLAGRPHDELTLCQIARAYEQATPWHQLRPRL
jgi:aspartyl-tRNA(Asn)/glutamyl-tRNA(Gln) amidotransferase subunit A